MHDRSTDSYLLEERQRTNELYGTFDFDAWILEITNPSPNESVLDLGCGRGKHIVFIAPRVSPEGIVTGIDISDESLAIARELCQQRGLLNVRLANCNLDEVPNYFERQQFDLILSSYAIYYSSCNILFFKPSATHTERGKALETARPILFLRQRC